MDLNRLPFDTPLIPTIHSFNRYYSPLPYPYTWCTHGNQAIIVNVNDHHHHYEQIEQPVYENYHQIHPNFHLESDDEVLILNSFDSLRQHYFGGYNRINRHVQVEPIDEAPFPDSFDHETEHYNGGLNKKVISEKLKLTIYSDDEEGEVCVICQVEFESSETLGVLECKHRYHPTCIKDWLIRKNVCPMCKAQALIV